MATSRSSNIVVIGTVWCCKLFINSTWKWTKNVDKLVCTVLYKQVVPTVPCENVMIKR